MYVPAHFAMTPEQVRTVLESGAAGDLVTVGPDGPVATYLPMLFDPAAGGLGSLIGHVSRVNDQWRTPGEALFILHGPDDYIEAEWLNTPGSANVPTWNYVTVHVYGRLVVHDDPGLDARSRPSAERRARRRVRRRAWGPRRSDGCCGPSSAWSSRSPGWTARPR